MEREKLKELLSKVYSQDSVKSILIGRMRPSFSKAIELEDKFNIPLSAWRDIKSYLQENDNKSNEAITRLQGEVS